MVVASRGQEKSVGKLDGDQEQYIEKKKMPLMKECEVSREAGQKCASNERCRQSLSQNPIELSSISARGMKL